jgi:membrane fusion protein (multidrug efflux system)
VKAIHFDSGQSVSRGALLVELDASAEASQLASAQAEVRLAAQTLDRMKSLRATGTNTQAELDIAVAREEQARAAVAGLQTTIAKKSIRAPFDGRLGVRTVELGQVLSPGTPLATLQSTSPMYAEFWLPQQALADLRTGMEARLVIDAYPRAEWTGAVSLVLPEVDVSTRSVRVRATFQNPEGRLRPGMYGSVALRAAEERPVLTIPSTAVLYAPYGDSVFTVQEQAGKQDGKAAGEKPPSSVAQQRFVQLGERRGDRITVESGLAAGETIVASGAFKLHNGSLLALKADPAAEPKTDAPAAGSELHTPVK